MAVGRAILKFLKSNWLSLSMLTAIICGAGLGVGLKKAKDWNNRDIMYVEFLGEIFMNLLKGICVPLVTTCIIVAFATLDTRLSKVFGLQVFLFIVITKLISTFIGMVAAILTKPGERGSAAGETIKIETTYRKETIDNFLDMINNIFPNNMMDAFFRQTTTNITKDADNKSHYGTTMIEGTNMLGLVSISIFIGLAMKTMGHLNKPLLDVIVVFGHVTFVIVNLIMMAAPLLLIFLVAGNTMKIEIKEFLTSMGFYALVTSLTQLAYFFIVYPLIIFIFGRTNPFKFYLGFLDGITTSFAVGSSMASLPVAIKCLDEKMGYDANLVSFVVPVCIATSKDGAAINIGFSAIFLAQYTKKALSVSDYCLIALFSLTLSVAAPGVPQGVVLMLMVVLEALGISPEYASTIIAVDIIVDRIVTMLNVTGSAVCVSVVDNFTRKKRAQFDKEREQSATNFKAETTEDIPTENPVENEN